MWRDLLFGISAKFFGDTALSLHKEDKILSPRLDNVDFT